MLLGGTKFLLWKSKLKKQEIYFILEIYKFTWEVKFKFWTVKPAQNLKVRPFLKSSWNFVYSRQPTLLMGQKTYNTIIPKHL